VAGGLSSQCALALTTHTHTHTHLHNPPVCRYAEAAKKCQAFDEYVARERERGREGKENVTGQ
jgi:hypothetical protein